MSVFFQKHKNLTTTTILAALVMVGAYLRLYNLEQRTGWGYDTARDIFAGQTISFNNVPSVGHYADGNSFYYPPYYYLLIKTVSLIDPDPIFVIGAFVMFESLVVLAAYYFGCVLFSKTTGLLSALFCTLTASLIDKGSQLWGAYVVIPATIFGLALIISGFHHLSRRQQLTGYLILLFFSTIHYSVLFVILYMLAVSLFARGFVKTLYLINILFGGFLLLNLPLIKYFGIPEFFSHFSPQTQANFHPNIIANFIDIWQRIWLDLFDYQKIPQCVAIVLIVVILIVNLIYNKKRQKIIILCLGMLFMVFIGSIKKGNINLHHYVLIEPVLLIIFSELLVFIWNRFSKIIPRIFTFLVASGFLFLFIHNFCQTTTVRNEIYNSKMAANYIKNIAVNKFIEKFAVDSSDLYSGWLNLGILYFLKQNHKVDVKYVNNGNNIIQIIDPNSPIFVVCIFYKEDQNTCLRRFQDRHPKHRFGYRIFSPVSNYEFYLYTIDNPR